MFTPCDCVSHPFCVTGHIHSQAQPPWLPLHRPDLFHLHYFPFLEILKTNKTIVEHMG
jgi:hypothetical protein